MLIDSHAHLDFASFDADREAVLARARDAGVEAVLTLGTSLASSQLACALAASEPHVFAAAGVHPHDAAGYAPQEQRAQLEQLWARDAVVAVGETGLDYHYDHSPRARQREVFAEMLRASAEVGLPIVIHLREAFDDGFALIEEVGLPAGGVLHCFTGGPRECERALALGLHISFAGIVTFPAATSLREAARLVPADRLLVETDAPFLAPVPERGRRNEPAFVVHTARKLASVRQLSFAELAQQTRRNTVELFSLPL